MVDMTSSKYIIYELSSLKSGLMSVNRPFRNETDRETEREKNILDYIPLISST